jgi:hypothetical protein
VGVTSVPSRRLKPAKTKGLDVYYAKAKQP